MILKKNVLVTIQAIKDEINEFEELVDICDQFGLDGLIKTVGGKTEYWYKDDIKNWIKEDEDLIRNEEE